MTMNKASEILGDRAIWELRNMKKALETFQILNTEEENQRLEAVNTILKNKRQ